MRKETVEYKVYKFNELSQEAQKTALENYRSRGFEYFWASENEDTLKAFKEVFPVTVIDWEYGYRNYINFEMTCDGDIADLAGIRLLKYLYNNYGDVLFKRKYIGHLENREKFTPVYSRCQKENSCVLTGYCIDDNILDPIYNFLKNPTNNITFEDLMGDCLNSWVKACDEDYQYQLSDEAIAEHFEANDYEFLENGENY